jgi:hypothetical protein
MTLEQRELCAGVIRAIRTRTLHAARVLACRDLTDMTAEQLRGRQRAMCIVLQREQKATEAFDAYLIGPDTPEAGEAAIAQLRFMDDHLLAFHGKRPPR